MEKDMAQLTSAKTSDFALPWGTWGLRLTAFIYIGLLVALPVFVVAYKGLENGLTDFWDSITHPIAYHAIKLTVWTAAVMALINTVMGTLTAYVLVKYRFPAKSLLNAFIDLPFAIPTLVTGVMLVLLYGPQTSAGMFIQEKTGEQILYAPPGILLALLFVGYPFVIRAVQPVLWEMDIHQEEAAHTLGAYSWGTFWRVILPTVRPAILTGALLSFARALGEFGAIIIVAGNLPMKSQTATVYIYAQVEGGNMAGASSVSLLLIFIALAVTLSVDLFKWRAHRV